MGQALQEFVRDLKTNSSATPRSQEVYVRHAERFLEWLGKTDDEIIGEVRACRGRDERDQVLQDHVSLVKRYCSELLDRGISRNTLNTYMAAVKAFYRAQGLDLPLRMLRRVYAETPTDTPRLESVRRMLDYAESARDRFIILALTLGGFRQGTLVRLQYRHIREDFESGRIPVKVHVPRELLKGKFRECDTFLGQEAVEQLRIYFNQRAQGALRYDGRGMAPEQLTEESPLLRDERSIEVKPVTEKQIWKMVHETMLRAGLIKLIKTGPNQNRYSMKPHGLRAAFRTQMEAGGIPRDAVKLMMGQTLARGSDQPYFNPEVEELRRWYAEAGIRVTPSAEVAEQVRKRFLIDDINALLRERRIEVPRSQIEQAVTMLTQQEQTQALREPEILERWIEDEDGKLYYLRKWVKRETQTVKRE